MLVSLLIPCKDEEAALPPLFLAISSLATSFPAQDLEVVFVDDGSTDGTAKLLEVAASASPESIRWMRLPRNRGLGAALRLGAPLTRGDIVVTYDADRAYPIEDVRRLVEPIVVGDADVVTASPWHPDGSADGLEAHREWLSRALSIAYRWRCGRRAGGLHTFSCGFRAFRRQVLLDCLPRSDGFVATTEILLNALRRGARVAERPARLRQRSEGRSKLRPLRVALSHFPLWLRG